MNATEASVTPAERAHALFVERGWVTTDLTDLALVRAVRDRLLERLRMTALPMLTTTCHSSTGAKVSARD